MEFESEPNLRMYIHCHATQWAKYLLIQRYLFPIVPRPLPPSAPGNRQSVFCLHEFACSEYLIWMKSCTRGSWLLCWCFSESMLQQRAKDDVFYIADDQYTFFWVKEEEWFPLTDSKVWRELVGRVWEELKLPPGSEGSFFRDRGRLAEAAPLTCCMTNRFTSLGWALYL